MMGIHGYDTTLGVVELPENNGLVLDLREGRRGVRDQFEMLVFKPDTEGHEEV